MDLVKLKPKELKVLADKELRKYLLRKTKSSGSFYFCPLKRAYYPADKMHVAHFIDRGKMSTRYSLINCHLISQISNTFDAQVVVEGFKSKHHKEYEEYLISKYGRDEITKLKEKSELLEVFTKEDYINTIEFLRNG